MQVVLAAGALASPQLLQLSGIGEPSVLEAAGVPVRHALPAVGEGLQDHGAVVVAYETPMRDALSEIKPFSPYTNIISPLALAKWVELETESLILANSRQPSTVHPISSKAEIWCVYFLSLLLAGRLVLVSILPSARSLLLNLFTNNFRF